MLSSRTFAALALAASATAQSTWVVDAAMGPGSQFADIQPAIDRSVDGDRILVRAGAYSKFDLRKAVSILGEPGVVVRAVAAGVVAVSTGRTVRLRGLQIEMTRGVAGTLLVHTCSTPVVLEGLKASLQVVSSTVTAAGCEASSVQVDDARLNVTESRIGFGTTAIGIYAVNSVVQLAHCQVDGGVYAWFPRPAILLSRFSVLAATGDGTRSIAAGRLGGTSVPAITGAGIAILDPRVRLAGSDTNAPKVDPNVTVHVRSVPYLRASGAPFGGTVQVSLSGGAGDPYFLAFGRPGRVVDHPTLWGSTWIDLPSAVLVATGTLDAGGGSRASAVVPQDRALLGACFTWQALSGPNPGTQTLSNPASYVHH